MTTNPNMVAIQTVTVGAGGAANIEFTNIPATYTDLALSFSIRSTRSATDDAIFMRINGDTGSNYSYRFLRGGGSAADSGNASTSFIYVSQTSAANSTASTFGNGSIYIPNYAGSSNKSVSVDGVGENNGTTAYTLLAAGLWSNTSAITSIRLYPENGPNFAQYSTATLYGVTSAGYGAKATGGIITQDANYFYHTFLSSGTFTPTSNITADYLVVAGGGGGSGSGAGAGGLRCTVGATGGGGSLESALSLTASTNYTVTIGAGGAGAANGQTGNGSNGSNSVFSSITSTGGAGGVLVGANQTNGQSGGSGSGGSNGGATTSSNKGLGGAGTANQGYAGGDSFTQVATKSSTGGGGGAGAVGGTPIAGDVAGAGGNGVTTSISGISTTYAGGGGGGIYIDGNASAGGAGGGGNGSTNNAAGSSGRANTGGGGGGFYDEIHKTAAYAGGSGIVIVRYAK